METEDEVQLEVKTYEVYECKQQKKKQNKKTNNVEQKHKKEQQKQDNSRKYMVDGKKGNNYSK